MNAYYEETAENEIMKHSKRKTKITERNDKKTQKAVKNRLLYWVCELMLHLWADLHHNHMDFAASV